MNTKVAAYVCDECGGSLKKWVGKCLYCGSWNTVREKTDSEQRQEAQAETFADKAIARDVVILGDANVVCMRKSTGYADIDRVLGSGLVEGSAILVGGDPGVGKSTIIMQVVNNISTPEAKTLYVSGEESAEQIQLRAQRLGIKNSNVMLLTCTNLSDVIATVVRDKTIRHVVIDSIQTMRSSMSDGGAGSGFQIKQCAHELTAFAKSHGVATIIIGHITKDGSVAGPKLLEHMVDAVLYFEGEKNYQFRVMRSIKNRYGPSGEIGILRMTEGGLEEVVDPSALFTANIEGGSSGSVIFAGIEGNRPILMEVQALVAPTYMAYPRRTVVGWDHNRLDMLLAILHARYKLQVLDKEVYLNVVGGIKTQEPALDLAVAMAVISSTKDFVSRHRYVAFGEIGLGGEVRPVPAASTRIKEAVKVGFNHIVVASHTDVPEVAANIVRVGNVRDLRSIAEG